MKNGRSEVVTRAMPVFSYGKAGFYVAGKSLPFLQHKKLFGQERAARVRYFASAAGYLTVKKGK